MTASSLAIAAMFMQSAPPPVLLPAPPPIVRVAAPPPPPPPPRGRDRSRPPRRIAGSIAVADYPAEALSAGAEGTVYARLDVSKRGMITNCAITGSSGNSALDAATCRIILARFRYEPATNRKGRKVAGIVPVRLVWRIAEDDEPEGVFDPKRPPPPSRPGQ